MSTLMEDDIKRWTAKRKTALVLDIIQGKTTISEASRAFDLNPRRLSNGSMKASVAWRTPCAPSPWKSKSSTRSNCANFSRPMAKPCWSCVPEKKLASLLGNEDEK
ncbi:Uncharacterised protein [Comamonas aquatica]|nr:Uncharacterised protein [Comamonas aquatica]